jgi:glycosyltransferase involved in cell wall biosynthesis
MIESEIPILIPAYQPGDPMVTLVESLLRLGSKAVVIVDDGSGKEYAEYFHEAEALTDRVHLLRHAVNLGKGAALKTGMNFVLNQFPQCRGVVTADADGQHHPEDVQGVAKRLASDSTALIMGVREFGKRVPWRSRIGNRLTRILTRLLVGSKVSDTQTGLRGIPKELIPHLLRIPSQGYEFELDMLIACKHQGFPIVQEPIRTIYLDGNRSSHFDPILDSMRIYFLLFRFSVLSLLTAVLDNLVFARMFGVSGSIGESQIVARLTAMSFNYLGVRSLVFHSQQPHRIVLPKYVCLVAFNGFVSYVMIQFMHQRLGLRAMFAKLLAEGLLFVANFAIQRDFVFSKRPESKTATDWDRYYTTVPATAKITRKYTNAILRDAIKRYAAKDERGLAILELGGANSCFVESILAATNCRSYDIVDTNRYGLSLLAGRFGSTDVVHLHQQSVFELSLTSPADVVFSVGLVEHFDEAETRQAILAHFDALRPGGLAIITFPTPTVLYRATRSLLESLGLWRFPDERPLHSEEVAASVRERAEIIRERTLWPLILTQRLIVARKTE